MKNNSHEISFCKICQKYRTRNIQERLIFHVGEWKATKTAKKDFEVKHYEFFRLKLQIRTTNSRTR